MFETFQPQSSVDLIGLAGSQLAAFDKPFSELNLQLCWRHDTQHDDTQHDDTQHKDI
jgi:hypothetical protein